jgi:hypothetical protein
MWLLDQMVLSGYFQRSIVTNFIETIHKIEAREFVSEYHVGAQG